MPLPAAPSDLASTMDALARLPKDFVALRDDVRSLCREVAELKATAAKPAATGPEPFAVSLTEAARLN
jgi:hypothetical protein